MIYIGVDPSLRGTGIAVADDVRVIELIRLGTEGLSRAKALSRILVETQAVVRRYRDAVVAIEGYALAHHASTGFAPVVEAGGVIRAAIGLITDWIEIPPSVWQQWAMGKNRIKKKENPTEYRSMAVRRTSCEHLLVASIDECDAAMIACYARDAHADTLMGQFRQKK